MSLEMAVRPIKKASAGAIGGQNWQLIQGEQLGGGITDPVREQEALHRIGRHKLAGDGDAGAAGAGLLS